MRHYSKMELVTLSAVLVLLLQVGSAQYCVPSSCSVQNSPMVADVPANTSSSDYFYIGGIFGVHLEGENFYSCGPIRSSGIQNLEAFLWAARTFKSRSQNILRDINIGAIAFDSCLSTDKSVQQILNLESCNVGYGNPVVEPNRLFAFVGPDRSKDAMTLANVMAELRKPIVSPAASSSELSSNEYKYFLRTVPPESDQIPAIMAILNNQGWNFTQLVYTDDEYGKSGRDGLMAAMGQSGKCIVSSYAISPSNPTESEIEELIEKLNGNSKTRAVVLFTRGEGARAVIQGATRARLRGRFSWIGTTSWADSDEVVQNLQDFAEGAITLKPDDASTPNAINTVNAFRQYYRGLTPDASGNAGGNPWFKQFWREKFNCYLPGESRGNYPLQCDLPAQSLADEPLDPNVPYTIRAVDAVLNGIEGARRTSCPGLNTLCSGFVNDENKGDIILDHITRVQIPGEIQFDPTTGDPTVSRYTILNLRQPGTSTVGDCNTQYCYTKVGSYDKLLGQAQFTDGIVSYDNQGAALDKPPSECPNYPCTECGMMATTTAMPTPGTGNSGTNGGSNQGSGGIGAASSGGLAAEPSPPPVKMRDETWVIVLIVLAGIGILLTLVFEFYLMSKIIGDPFIKHWRTMWLGQLLLLAVFLCYLTLFAFVPTPTKHTCGIIRFGVGSCYAMCFSILLVKLMIILSSKSVGYLKGIFQVLMFIFAWGVQIVVDVEWLILRPPEVVMRNTTGVVEWVCKVEFEDHLQSLVYVMFLIIMCTMVAVKAHGIITNHREGIFIGLVSGFTIPVWIGWILLGVFNDDRWHDPALAFGLFITATLILFIMYLPKVRQLNSMGVEGIYAEDDAVDYAPSFIQPSVVPAGSVIYGGPPSYRSKPASPGSVIYVDGVAGNGGAMYSEPNTLLKAPHIQVEGDPNALYLKHPGAAPHRDSGYNTTPSVRSAPAGYILRRNPNLSVAPTSGGEDIHSSTRVLRMTNDLSGRLAMDRKAVSEANFNMGYAPREGYSTLQYPTYKSKGSAYSIQSGTLKKPKSLQDLGSL